MPRVVIYLNRGSMYGMITTFCRQLADGFIAQGCETLLFDHEDGPELEQELLKIISSKPDMVIVIGFLPLFPEIDGKLAYDVYDVPIIQILVDHPFNAGAGTNMALNYPIENRIVTCVDRTHVEELDHHFGSMKGLFLAHGGLLPSAPVDQPRPIDLLFTGTYRDPEEQRREWHNWPHPVSRIIQEMIDATIDKDTQPFLPHLIPLLKKRGITYGPEFRHLAHIILQGWDFYMRAVRRRELIKTLDHANLPVDIYGQLWHLYPNENHRIHGEIASDKIPELFSQTKILLNIGPNFPNGSHERVFTGMICGALVITDRNSYWEEHFTDQEELFLYDFTNLEKIPQMIRELQSDPERLQRVAKAGQEKALKNHTWKNRAAQLLAEISV